MPPRKRPKVHCPFCKSVMPKPKHVIAVYSSDCEGGRCDCGAVFVVDETGRLGGQALLDAQAMIADDLKLALQIDVKSELDIEKRPFRPTRATSAQMMSMRAVKSMVWFVRRKPE